MIFFVLVVLISGTALLYVTVHKFRPLVLLTAATRSWWTRLWCIYGTILIEKNRITRRKTCPSAPLSTKNPIWIGHVEFVCYLNHRMLQTANLASHHTDVRWV